MMREAAKYDRVTCIPGQCYLCKETKDVQSHYVPDRGVEVPDTIKQFFVVHACKACKSRVYGHRHTMLTIESQMKPDKAIFVSMAHNDYVKHPDYDEERCMYCGEYSTGTNDFMPARKVLNLVGEVYKAPKHAVNCCPECKRRIYPKSGVLHTFEARYDQMQKLLNRKPSEGEEAKILASLILPWQIALYDENGKRGVHDREDSLLDPEILEEKLQWLASRAKDHVSPEIEEALRSATVQEEITLAAVPDGDVDDIISGWEHD